jgi:indolepyruvate decarboxylase
MMSASICIADYLIQALVERGVGHIFGVPGDYSLKFCERLTASRLRLVTTCDEQGAGFAADAYARLRGLGAVCVTYGVGAFKVANTTAQAFAERSPVVVLSGAPGLEEQRRHALLHHKVRDYGTQMRVFGELTVASAVLDDPWTALREIDRVLHAAVEQSRPVYLELPRDVLFAAAPRPPRSPRIRPVSDPQALAAAMREAVDRLRRAERPAILAGPELHRFNVQGALLQLAERTGIPVASTLLGKSVMNERHPSFIGVYQGAMSAEGVRRVVEEADCLVMLGVMMTDLDLGGNTARLDLGRAIDASVERVALGPRTYEAVRFADFVTELAAADIRPTAARGPIARVRAEPTLAEPGRAMTVARLFARLDAFLTDTTVVVADTGDAMFAAAELSVHREAGFLAPAYYASLGFAVPAALGVQLADPRLRPLVLVGDGAFQMTGMELSTIARLGLSPIVIVLNNAGFLTERLILDGAFNDVLPWRYHQLPALLGAGRGVLVETEEALERALAEAATHVEGYFVIEVRLDPLDASPALRRLGQALARS